MWIIKVEKGHPTKIVGQAWQLPTSWCLKQLIEKYVEVGSFPQVQLKIEDIWVATT